MSLHTTPLSHHSHSIAHNSNSSSGPKLQRLDLTGMSSSAQKYASGIKDKMRGNVMPIATEKHDDDDDAPLLTGSSYASISADQPFVAPSEKDMVKTNLAVGDLVSKKEDKTLTNSEIKRQLEEIERREYELRTQQEALEFEREEQLRAAKSAREQKELEEYQRQESQRRVQVKTLPHVEGFGGISSSARINVPQTREVSLLERQIFDKPEKKYTWNSVPDVSHEDVDASISLIIDEWRKIRHLVTMKNAKQVERLVDQVNLDMEAIATSTNKSPFVAEGGGVSYIRNLGR
jgi:hypothetical protein